MSELATPLTPSDCDLSDFDRMPLDIKRLGGSKFDAGLDDSAWRAGVNLWMSAWHARPAGSLDDDEEALCTAAGLRDLKKWAKVRAKAMREHWVRCADGRLYHKTLCELAIEAWLDKLFQRLSSGAGNAKRWGSGFDEAGVITDIETACEHLERLNRDSKALAKARRRLVKRNPASTPDGNPDGNDKPNQTQSRRDRPPRGETSQENGMERIDKRIVEKVFDALWAEWPDVARKRHTQADCREAIRRQLRAGGQADAIIAAGKAHVAERMRDGKPETVKGIVRWLANGLWRNWAPNGDASAPVDWDLRLGVWRDSDGQDWPAKWGPKPNEAGFLGPKSDDLFKGAP